MAGPRALTARERTRNLACVWAIQTLDAVDCALVGPSMAGYLASLGGSRNLYGLSVTLFWVGRLLLLPVFGAFSDRGAYATALNLSLALGVLGAALYTAPNVMGEMVWLVPIGRFVLGASAGIGSTILAFTARVSESNATAYLGFAQMIFNTVQVISPAIATALAQVPPIHTSGGELRLDPFGYCGLFILILNLAALVMVAWLFTNPILPCDGATLPRVRPSLPQLGRHLLKSRGWVTFVLSFQNNFSQTVVFWALPLVSEDSFGWTQTQNGLVLMSLGIVGTVVTTLAIYLSSRRGWQDRATILAFQVLVGISLLALVARVGCGGAGELTPAVFLLILGAWSFGNFGQIPGNLGLFAKLVGPENLGVLQAALLMNNAVSRSIAGIAIGHSYSGNNACSLWSVTFGLWVVQMFAFLPIYPRLSIGVNREEVHPAAPDDYHALSPNEDTLVPTCTANDLPLPVSADIG